MKEAKKQLFIEQELCHELRCLLGSATVWRIFKQQKAGYDVVVAADSALMHARTLFEFFTADTTNKNTIKVIEFGTQPYKSELYSRWKEPLHRHVLHLNHKRLKPTNSKSTGQLKDQVEIFAREILKLWERLEKDPGTKLFQPSLTKARQSAINDARIDAGDRIEPLFA